MQDPWCSENSWISMNNQNAKSDNIFKLENVSCFPCLKDLLGLFYGAEMQQKNDFRQNYRLRLTIFDEQNCLKIVKIRFFCIPSKLKSRNLSQNTYHGSYCYNQHIKECFRIYCWWNSTHDITATLWLRTPTCYDFVPVIRLPFK